ncbi:MAG TPA: hypothetical protein VHB47_01500 [Thermoanaerobaculia bacterium]|jgi:hypothetical protein|nr:hypothetical protein [Thermoanaerobaculia bacterium]
MRSETRAEVDSALHETEEATSQLRRIQDVTRKEIEDIAKKYSAEKSSFLVAVAGGIAGAVGGVTLHGALGLILAVTGPAGAALGAALALLAWRGGAQWKLERATERAKIALDQIRSELKSLPSGTPSQVKADLWRGYQDILAPYLLLAARSVGEADVRQPRIPGLTELSQDQLQDAPKKLLGP